MIKFTLEEAPLIFAAMLAGLAAMMWGDHRPHQLVRIVFRKIDGGAEVRIDQNVRRVGYIEEGK